MFKLEERTGLDPNAYLFIFGFIFLYIAISYFGASMELAAILSGAVIIGAFVVINRESIKKVFILKPKEKKEEFDDVHYYEKEQKRAKSEPKVIEGEIVKSD